MALLRSIKTITRITALSQAVILRALTEEPSSVAELMEISGLSKCTVQNYLLALRKAKLIYVAAWESDPNGRMNTPCYKWGSDKSDVKKPMMTKAEIAKRYRQRKKLKELHNGLTNSIKAG
jgi:DNA-binding transcriptional ArsR family regulator